MGARHQRTLRQEARNPACLAELPVEGQSFLPTLRWHRVVLLVRQPQRPGQGLSSHRRRRPLHPIEVEEVVKPAPPFAQVAMALPERPQRSCQPQPQA